MRNLGRSQLGGSLLGSSHDCSQMSAGASEGSLGWELLFTWLETDSGSGRA